MIKAEDENKEYLFELSKFNGNYSSNLFNDFGDYATTSFSDFVKLTLSEYKKTIIENVRKIAANEEALNEFISKMPPYECLEFIEKK